MVLATEVSGREGSSVRLELCEKHEMSSEIQPENEAIANALQLEAARRRAGPIPLSTSPLASLKSLSLSVAVLQRIYC